MNQRLRIPFILILGLSIPQVSFAEVLGMKVGADLGLNLGALTYVDNRVSGNTLGWGAQVEYRLFPNIGVGLSLSSAAINPTVGTLSFSSIGIGMQETYILGDFNYVFSENLSPLYLGIRLGIGLTSISVNATPAASLAVVGINGIGVGCSFATGILAGYDLPVVGGFSFGPRLSYVIHFPSWIDGGIITVLQVQGAIKYTF